MKHRHKTLAGALVVAALAAALALIAAGSQGALAQAVSIIYVDASATGRDDGTTWRNAFIDLQDALDLSDSAAQIWVAEGIYTPTRRLDADDPRSATFQMVNGVTMLGGFDPGTGAVKLDDRDWVAHVTTLSGDIGVPGDPSDNVYHVVFNPNDPDGDPAQILDGVTIADGNAGQEDPSGFQGRGGGILNEGSALTLRNITFKNNSAVHGGAILFSLPLDAGEPLTLTNVTFQNNSAESGGGAFLDVPPGAVTDTVPIRFTNCNFSGNLAVEGGAVYIDAARAVTLPHGIAFTNCIFSDNIAERGGAVAITWGEPDEEGDPLPIRFTNCIFWSNDADLGGGVFITDGELDEELPALRLTNCTFSGNGATHGGAIYALGPVTTAMPLMLTNSILWGDTEDEIYPKVTENPPLVTYSDIEGGYVGEGNIDADPLFVNPEEGDLHLQADSPCIDVGSNDAPDIPKVDFDGQPRIMDGDDDGEKIVDMGADEFKMPAIWVEIDVTPDVPSNVIKLGSPRRVPVAILSTDDFDATEVIAVDTVEFAGATHVGFTFVDVNRDGHADVLLDFRARDMVDLDQYSTEATLTGKTQDEMLIEGTAEVQVIP